MKHLFKGHNASLVNHIFQTLLVTYLILLLVEQIWTGMVSTYLNLNYLLIVVIASGILDVLSEHRAKEKEKVKKRDYLFIVLLGIAGFFIIKFKTIELGWLSWVISIVAGVLIILLSLLVMEEDEEKEEKEEKSETKLSIKGGIVALLLLGIISLALNIFTSLSILEALRIVFGSVYVLFLPGFVLSFVFFIKGIDWIERIALSFALSIAVVPLAVFYLNLVGVRINLLNSSLTILGVIVISAVILIIQKRYRKKKNF